MNGFGRLTGWQIAAIVCTALTVPTALYAVTYSNVAVINPTTGTPALIDAGGALHNLDVMAQYANNPANKISIQFPNYTATGCDTATFTLPAGKALVVTSMTGDYYNASGGSYSGMIIYGGSATPCGGNQYIKHYVPMPATAGAIVDINYDYGAGVAIPAGTISMYSANNTGWTHIHGYLVPAALVTASGSFGAGTTPGAFGDTHGPSAK